MKVNTTESIYQEKPDARDQFNRQELKHLRLLLRRLRFLETQINSGDGMASGNGGSAFAEWEADALAYVLTEIDFLKEVNS